MCLHVGKSAFSIAFSDRARRGNALAYRERGGRCDLRAWRRANEVMAASGVSKSQLHHYFADKDALILEVIAFQAERVLAAQEPHLGALDSLRALRAWGPAIILLKSTKRRNCRWTRRFAGRPMASPVTASVTVVGSMSPGLNFRQPAPTA